MASHAARLEKAIGHDFRNPLLLREALTHPSYTAEKKSDGPSYQRLEFLGDAVLQLAITDCLYARFPLHDEGLLTKMRSFLVNRSSLAGLAKCLGLGDFLRFGKGEERSGGREKDSNLADCFEALIGAVYRDAGWRKTRTVIRKIFSQPLEQLAASPDALLGNPKGLLQELLQKEGGAPPRYRCVRHSGAGHRKSYSVVVEWGETCLGKGCGSSKKEAELNAANDALARIAPHKLRGSPSAVLHKPG